MEDNKFLINKAFTLVEIIVAITIIVILSTVAFISYENYTSNARDSTKLLNVWHIKNSLELYYSKQLRYPTPDSVYGTGQVDWVDYNYIWYIWDNLIKLLNIDWINISDSTDYIYATTYDYKKYQIATVLENKDSIADRYINQAYANGKWIAYVIWNYKWIYKTYNPSSCKVFSNIPSLLFNSWWIVNLLDDNIYYVINKEYNTPYQTRKDESNNLYKWSEILQKYYNSTNSLSLTWVTICWNITNTIFENTFTWSTLEYFWWKSYKEFLRSFVVDWDSSMPALVTINDTTNLYTMTNVVNIFTSWSTNVLTNNWHINWCDPSVMKVDNTTFTWWNQTISTALVLTWNTIYLAPAGTYNLNWATSGNWYISMWWDCIWLIWAWTGLTVFSWAFTSWWIKSTDWIIWVRSAWLDRKNVIISWLTVLNNKSSTNRHNIWVYADDKTANITLKDIQVFNSQWAWVQFDDSSNYHYISNIFVSWNWWPFWWFSISYNSNNNIIKNIFSSWTTSSNWILVDWTCNNNTLDNLVAVGNWQYWVVVQSWSSNNKFTNINSYNNTRQWLYMNWTANNNTFSWVNIYQNNRSWLRFDNVAGNILNNFNVYNNTRAWMWLTNSASGNTFNNFEVYNNTWSSNFGAIRIETTSNFNSLNNFNIYSNRRTWLNMDSSMWNNFNNFNIFNNNVASAAYYWEIELTNSKYNAFNNMNIFNNNSNWIHPAISYGNLFNNINVFSNLSNGNWAYIESTSTWTILNNVNMYNNWAAWIINYWASNKYFWTVKYFGNVSANTISPAFLQWTWSTIWFIDWTLTWTTDTMSCDWHINPNSLSTYGSTCADRWFTGSLVIPVTSYSFWSSVPLQTQPVKWNWYAFVLYWTWWLDYDVSKKIWQR